MSFTHSSLHQHNQTTFSRDLEFVSSLANPYYLHHLALDGHLSDPSFLTYLSHLDYFRHPKYVKYLHYPHALTMLELLQHPEFRQACKDTNFINEIMSKQVAHWATWRNPDDNHSEQDHNDLAESPSATDPNHQQHQVNGNASTDLSINH